MEFGLNIPFLKQLLIDCLIKKIYIKHLDYIYSFINIIFVTFYKFRMQILF